MIVIRPAEVADLPAILAIYNDAILHTTAVYQYQPHTLAMRRQWYDDKLAAGFPVLAAIVNENDGRVTLVGFGAYGEFRHAAAYQYTVEHSVYVDGAWRRHGIGRLLLQALIDHAQANGKHVMVAGVDAENAASLRFHQALGFAEVAHLRQVGYKFDRWLDLILLQRDLSPGAVPGGAPAHLPG